MRLQLIDVRSQVKFQIDGLPVLIGRDTLADIELTDPALPPLQCMIDRWNDGGVGVWSLREDFPVFLNGRRVDRARLSAGDSSAPRREFPSVDMAIVRPRPATGPH